MQALIAMKFCPLDGSGEIKDWSLSRLSTGIPRQFSFLILGMVITAALASCGPDATDLKAGDCFKGNPLVYGENIEAIDCKEATFQDWKVVSAEKATGNQYPGNLNVLRVQCEGQGPGRRWRGTFFPPSKSTWDEGDRVALCLKNAGLSRDN